MLLATGGLGGWLGTMIVGTSSSTAQIVGFLGGAAFVRGIEYSLEEEALNENPPSENKRSAYSYIAGVGAVSLGVAAAWIVNNNAK